MALANVNAPNTQNPFSGATGGALDTQGRFSFGGITTTGLGGTTSTSSSENDVQSYVAMAVIAVAVVAMAFLFFKR